MTGYVIRRLIWMLPLLWAVATITFFLMHAVPGGPFDSEKKLPPTVLANLNAKYGLADPIISPDIWNSQYGKFFGNLAQGDLGTSFRTNEPVTNVLRHGVLVTAQLGLVAFAFAIIFGLSLGVLAALNQNKMGDYLSVFFATVGTAMPSFVIATFLVVIFSVKLGWFDVLGWEFGNYRKMVLPVVSLGLLPAAYIARITRASMLEVLGQDYIRTARAKGLKEQVVILRHAVKNAMVPVLTVLGPYFAFLVTGSFIIETIFSIPGVGRAFVSAVFNRDYGMIMGAVLFYAVIVAAANLVVDILYAFVDPRIRYS
jgi:ABC-type dipeptide/oligopeptide/nickel transport systems, permease components